MGKIRMKIEVAAMELPFLFIDSYMLDCLPVYPLIYIYSYRHALVGNTVTCQDIEDTFQLTEKDVRKAWKHWETKGLVTINHSNDDDDDMDITFLPVTISPTKVIETVSDEGRFFEYEKQTNNNEIVFYNETRNNPINTEGNVAGVSTTERRGFGGGPHPINAEGSVAGVSVAERRGFGGGQRPIKKEVLDSQIYLNLNTFDSPNSHSHNSSNSPNSGVLSITQSSLNATNSSANNKPESILEIRRRMMPTQPNYSVLELAEYKTNSREIAHLFAHAEQALGKLLSPTDMSKIFSFHDWLGLPTDVIEYLLTYCTDNDKRNLKYIETCAIDWAERGIEDLVMALEYVQSFDTYNSVLRRLGLKNVTTSGKKSFEKWTTEWKMPLELILNACDRAVENNAAKMGYVEGILKKWYNKGINTAEGVRKDDEEFENAKQLKIDSRTVSRTDSTKKKFANFQQRDTDLSHVEQQAWEYQMQKAQALRDTHKKTWRERMAEDDAKLLLKKG